LLRGAFSLPGYVINRPEIREKFRPFRYPCRSGPASGLRLNRLALISVPRSAVSGREFCYARLLRRVHPDRAMADAFEGALLKPGSHVDESALWPDARYPAKPVLLEFAGSDHTGSGHNRSNQIYILWRYEPEPGEWVEIVRCLTQNADWITYFIPIALAELGGMPAPDADVAAHVAERLAAQLDQELKGLSRDDRSLVLNLFSEQVAARMMGRYTDRHGRNGAGG
jgi:hypothetical protein